MKCPSFQKRTGRQNEPLQTDEVSVSPVVSSVCYLKALESENRLKQQGDTAVPIGWNLPARTSEKETQGFRWWGQYPLVI